MTAVSNLHDGIPMAVGRGDAAGTQSQGCFVHALLSSRLSSGRMNSGRTDLASMAGGNRRGPPRNPRGPGKDDDGRTDLITKTRPKTKKPSLYKVVLLNDDYTPMEFVIDVLERFFSMGREDATQIMLHVHHKGKGICGVFTYEIAETKVTQVTDYARQNQHPLQCAMEKE